MYLMYSGIDMQKTIFTVLLLATVSTAHAGLNDNYFRLAFGVNKPDRVSNANLPLLTTVGNTSTSRTKNYQYRTGHNVSLALGIREDDWRLEAEALYMTAKSNDFRDDSTLIPGSPATGKTTVNALMLNLIHDFKPWVHNLTPYAGMGFGHSKHKNRINLKTGEAGMIKDSAFAGQILAGFSYDISSFISPYVNVNGKLTLDFTYRYFLSAKISALDKKFQNHLLDVGVGYSF